MKDQLAETHCKTMEEGKLAIQRWWVQNPVELMLRRL
jgi:hypothetical protein